jgi:cytoskeletal protein CcmA (bactofilin family)
MFQKDNIFNKKEDNPRRDGKPTTTYGGTGAGLPSGSPSSGSTFSSLNRPEDTSPVSGRTTPAEEPKGSRLIVGPDIKLKGAEITDCDTLIVEGRVEASMDSRVIQIAERGSYIGKVSIDIAELRGRFEGELTARKQLIIHSTGNVSGKIRYGKIVIEEGGEIAGDVAMLTSSSALKAVPPGTKDEPSTLAEVKVVETTAPSEDGKVKAQQPK